MFIEEFAMQIIEAIKEKLNEDIELRVKQVKKDSGVIKTGIAVLSKGKQVTPCLYVNDVYAGYQRGDLSLQEAAQIIYEALIEGMEEAPEFDLEKFCDWDQIKGSICARIINEERNKEKLENMPHRMLLNLAVVYYVKVSEADNEFGTIEIMDGHLKMWGKSEEELYSTAMTNMIMNEDVIFKNIREMIPEELCDMPLMDDEPLLYVLANQKQIYGASVVLNKQVLKMISELVGKDFILLPSSVHEMLVVPQGKHEWEISALSQMVHDANRMCVGPEDYLSDNVYKYVSDKEELELVG